MQDHRSVDAPMSPERMQVRFGPRTVMVERFLLHLSKLRVAEWIAAGATFEALSRGQLSQFPKAAGRIRKAPTPRGNPPGCSVFGSCCGRATVV